MRFLAPILFGVFQPFMAGLLLCAVGCGSTREREATTQLVMSDAVDRSISVIDFRPLAERKVYLDTSYLRHVKGQGFVNSEYVTSALRQQIMAGGCLLQDTQQEADVIIEARIGVLGLDDHRVTYGVPENNALSSAIRLIPNAPTVPVIPELALARRDAREAASKVACFAYDRETRKPIWQSGVRHSLATAKDTWVLGVGPFQGGTIREQTKLAGSKIKIGPKNPTGSPAQYYERPAVDHSANVRYNNGWPILNGFGTNRELLGVPIPQLDQVPPPPDSDSEVEIAEEPETDDGKVIADAADDSVKQR